MIKQKVEYLLKKNNESKYALSKATGIANSTLNNMFFQSKDGSMNIAHLILIADHYKVSLDWLAGRHTNTEKSLMQTIERLESQLEECRSVNKTIRNTMLTLLNDKKVKVAG